jgi:translation initiation factor IF-1
MLVGTVVELQPWPWGLVTVEFPGGERMTSHLAAALRLRLIRLHVGDGVEVEEVVPGRGRVVGRLSPPADTSKANPLG